MSQRGRVLFVTGEYPPMRGGVGDYTARLIQALEDTGWQASILTAAAARDNDDPRVLPWVTRWDWTARRVVRRAVEATGADLVHIQYQTGAFAMHPVINLLPMLLRRVGPRVPVAVTFHDLRVPYLFPKAGRVRQWANRLLATSADAVIATNALDRNLLYCWPRVAERTVLIPIGSNLPDPGHVDAGAVRARLGIAEGECAVGFFGFLTRDKGVDLLLDALERQSEHRVRLVIVGGGLGDTDAANADYHRTLRERLARSSVPSTVTGHLEPRAAAEALAALDLVVLPFCQGASLRNGTLIAAVRAGAPVVTTVPAPGDALDPLVGGESVWLVPPGDVGALTHAVASLLRDASMRARMRQEARAAAAAFDWSRIAARHASVYESVLGKRAGTG
ncbi:MAG: glycosyltransferase [Sphaerobacter thermophilus]|uniref:Glycosyl transferase group 1 n=1 Tax=Sphaerobacter thermophilus (strain ATCC 49802 / DSM 20745 / KCCM 41009 / NCIMB 13125 / S 6022) TaxID=479434 RepID=D1C1I3_SPHTD|nr:glycosyltransferase [Sphaerobacter thermophilus]ACZ38100.1 glycosyl transferase group 1 [Sphaerobacter thermophilus DSM 20745]PZN65632.1 MAG: glycosyl transferase family 1 [Sphaerobacter thermophilus]